MPTGTEMHPMSEVRRFPMVKITLLRLTYSRITVISGDFFKDAGDLTQKFISKVK